MAKIFLINVEAIWAAFVRMQVLHLEGTFDLQGPISSESCKMKFKVNQENGRCI